MPVALLLQNVLATLRTAETALAPWREIVPLESTVVGRARSAFLVHWFGPRLPLDGLTLSGYVVNTDELARRYGLAQRSIPSSQDGPNLTEPLLGFAGLVAGVLMSPVGAIVGVRTLLHAAGFGLMTVLGAFVWLATPASLLIVGLLASPVGIGVLFGGLVAGGAGGYALAGGLADRRDLRALFDVFGSLARLMNAGVVFLDQLIGPRAQVRNPLLRQILKLADRLAPLFAQILGAVAVVVRRVGPILGPVARTILALAGLVGAAAAALGDIFRGLADRLEELAGGPLSIMRAVNRVTATAQLEFAHIHDAMTQGLGVIVGALSEVGPWLTRAFSSFVNPVGDDLRQVFKEHNVMRIIDALTTQISLIAAVWTTAVSTTAPSTTTRTKAKPSVIDPLLAKLRWPLRAPSAALPAFPHLPAIPGAAQREQMRQSMGIGAVPPVSLESVEALAARLGPERDPSTRLELGGDTRGALERSLGRPSAFAADRRGVPTAVLPVARDQLAQLRQALSVVVGRVLPPEMRAVYAPQLADTLATIDREVYDVTPKAPSDLPLLDLPASDSLKPHVRRLRLRMPGASRDDASRFEDLVVERLRRQTCTITGAVPAAAGAR
jgi:hypothetical protein